MTRLLFVPGALFLLVVFFRVVLPYLSTAPWKRLVDSARYYRHHKNYDKSDRLLEKALSRFPKRPEVRVEYCFNHSRASDVNMMFGILMEGYSLTGDTVLSFIIGSMYLEHGMMQEASRYLDTPACREYMKTSGLTLIPELYLEMGEYKKAEREFLLFHSERLKKPLESVLYELGPEDLLLLAFIRKKSGSDFNSIMEIAPKTSKNRDMGWQDLHEALTASASKLVPAVSGINGSADDFNRRRKEFFAGRIALIEDYL